MVCECGPKCGCKTNRCACNEKGKKCNSKCECNPDVCTNREVKEKVKEVKVKKQTNGCSCGPQSQCITDRCNCRKNNQTCDEGYCGCNSSKCKNTINAYDDDSNDRNAYRSTLTESPISSTKPIVKMYSSSKKTHNENIDDWPTFLDSASGLTYTIRREVTSKQDEVIEYRNGIDLYTKENLTDPKKRIGKHVDHIIEDQIVGHAAAKVLYRNDLDKGPFLEPLKSVLNDMDNYNVTDGRLNQSKGGVIRNYLRDRKYLREPLRVAALDSSATHFKEYVNNIIPAMSESGDFVLNNIGEARRSDNHVSGRQQFMDISESLSTLLEQMDLNMESQRLRNRRK